MIMNEEIKTIDIIDGDIHKKASIQLKENDLLCILEISYDNGVNSITSENSDYFSCFMDIRKRNPHIKFLCKGAKINVYPSSIARQMSQGKVAYECTMGKSATRDNIVHIFDFDDENISNSPIEQIEYHKKWFDSLKKI